LHFAGHVGHGEHILAALQTDRQAAAALHRIGHRHHAVLGQQGVAQGFGGRGQGVMCCHSKHKGHIAQDPVLDVGGQVLFQRHAQRQIGLP
jgi:hypothetical protein